MRKRLNTGRACGNCRRSKRRCDGSCPCSTCLRYGHECRYPDPHATVPRSVSARLAISGNSKVHDAPEKIATPATLSLDSTDGVSDQPAPELPRGGYIAPAKGRFIADHSSAAQPRSLGLKLGLAEPPRLHAFAYHLGIRKEPRTLVCPRLAALIPWEQTRSLIDIFVSIVHPVFGFIDSELLYKRGEMHWHEEQQDIAFEAFVGGVIALGSFFSNQLPEDMETEVALHVKAILEDPVVGRQPSMDLASGWILRTLYVRATGRPYSACASGLAAINIIEAMGLHREAEVLKEAEDPNFLAEARSSDSRERLAHVAQSLHFLLSYDFGRSIVNLKAIPCSHIRLQVGDFTQQLFRLTDAIREHDTVAGCDGSRDSLSQALLKLLSAPDDHDFLTLTKAELCFALYRRLRLLDPGPKESQVQDVLKMGMSAIPAARRLAALKHPWWNIINAMFQYLCVLLSINSTESLKNLAPTLETLEIIDQCFSSRLTQEALVTARSLIRACMEIKDREVSSLRLIVGEPGQQDSSIPGDNIQYPVADVDLEAFLQSTYSTSFLDMVQFQ